MPRLVLTRALTYVYRRKNKILTFKRGQFVTVPEPIYHDLIRLGGFADPDHHIDFINPAQLRMAPSGSTIPVIRDMGLGDVLMVTIPLRELAERNPHLSFIYAMDSRYVDLCKDLPFLKKAVAISQLRGTYNYGIDLRGFVERSPQARRLDRIDIFSQYLLGGPPRSYSYPHEVKPEWVSRGRALIGADRNSRPTVGLVIKASMDNRSWGWDYLQRFCALAVRDGWRVVLLHHRPVPPDFMEHPSIVDLTGTISVEDLMHVVAAVDVVVSPDTGTAHLAEALKTKCVAYFTTVPPDLRVSHYRYARVLYPEGKLGCLGCIHSPRCGQPDPKPCAQLSTPEMAWQQVRFVHDNEPPWPLLPQRDRVTGGEIRFQTGALA